METGSESPTLHGVRDEFARWLKERGGPSEHTVRAYSSDVSAMVRAFHRDMGVTEIDAARIRHFFELQQQSGLEATTLRRRAAGIRCFCQFLEHQRFVEKSPWPPEGFRFQKTRRLPRVLSSADLKNLLRHLMNDADVDEDVPHDAPLVHPVAGTLLLATALMLTTGLRVGELVSFRTSDLSLSNLSVQVLGKGRRERIVYLTDEWLVRLIQAYGVTRERLGVKQEPYLFNSRLGPVSTASIRTRLAVAGEAAGVQHRVTPHMLRHSAATQLIEAGVNIRFVQRLLGHASLATTEIYTHVRDQALQHAIVGAGVLAQNMTRSS